MDKLASIYRGMFAGSLPVGIALAPRLAAAGATHLADIGGGSGGVAIGACLNVPGLRATIVDLPNVVSAAEPFITEAGFGDRVSMLAGDVVTAPPALRFDAAVVKSVIQGPLARQRLRAASSCGQAMAPGGHMFIVGQVLDDLRTSPASIVGFLILVLLNVYDDGQAFTENEHRTWLAEAEFGDIIIEAGSMPGGGASLITARKLPSSLIASGRRVGWRGRPERGRLEFSTVHRGGELAAFDRSPIGTAFVNHPRRFGKAANGGYPPK